MSAKHPVFVALERIVRASPFTPTERLVGLALAHHLDETGTAWPSMSGLCKWTGLGLTAVRSATARLCCGSDAVFELVKGGARVGDRYQRNRYRLREGSATRAPRETSPSPGDAEGSATRARGVRHAPSNRPIEQSIEQSTTRSARGVQAAVALIRANGWPREAAGDWSERFGGTASHGRIGKALAPLVRDHGWLEVRRRWRIYLGQAEARYASPSRFAETFGSWDVASTADPRATRALDVARRYAERGQR